MWNDLAIKPLVFIYLQGVDFNPPEASLRAQPQHMQVRSGHRGKPPEIGNTGAT